MFSELWLMKDSIKAQISIFKLHFFLHSLTIEKKRWKRILHWRWAKYNVEKIIRGYGIKEQKFRKMTSHMLSLISCHQIIFSILYLFTLQLDCSTPPSSSSSPTLIPPFSHPLPFSLKRGGTLWIPTHPGTSNPTRTSFNSEARQGSPTRGKGSYGL